MKSLSMILSMVVVSVLIGGCSLFDTTQTAKIVDCEVKFNKALDKFEKSRITQNEKLSNTLEISPLLSQENPDIVKISRTWEVNWNKVKSQFEELESRFNVVYNESNNYFNELNRISSSISSKNLRKSEMKKNENIKAAWSKIYDDAYNNMVAFKKILTEGDDYSKIFQAASVRADIRQKISELTELIERALVPIENLKKLSIEGRKLINSDNKLQTTIS